VTKEVTMSSFTVEPGPVLVSDLPPVSVPAPRAFATVRARWAAARDQRLFNRAVRAAGPDERSDLLAAARRL
jgi:hypothetical protein